MASTYSTSLKIQKMGNGENSGTWGSITNTNWDLIEQAVAGVQTITMSNANYTLTNLNGVSDEARNMVLVVGGTNSAIYQIVAPLAPKFYVVSNQTSGGYAITIGGASGSLVTIPNGTTAQVYCDGTSFYSAQTSSAGNFTVNGNESVVGTLSVGGNTTLTGTLGVTSTSAFTGASTFTGAVALNGGGTSTTPTVGDNSTKIATTAFVSTAVGTLGTMASQNANNVAITGGTITGTTVNGNVIGSNSVGARTVSTSAPTGGSNGDIWYQV